jgi:hypothetical protein
MKKFSESQQNFYGNVRAVVGRDIIINDGDMVTCGISTDMVVGSGVEAVRQISLDKPFTNLEITGSFEVEVQRGEFGTFDVSGDDNLLDFVEAEIKGSTLELGFKSNTSFCTKHPLKVRISAPAIADVSIIGSCEMELKDLVQDSLSVDQIARQTPSFRAGKDSAG